MMFLSLQRSSEMIKRDSNHTFSRFVVITRYVCHLGTIRSLIGETFPLSPADLFLIDLLICNLIKFH